MLTLQCFILRYSNALCPTPTPPSVRAGVLRIGCLACRQARLHTLLLGSQPPASNKEAVSLKTLSECLAVGLQVVLLAAEAFGGKLES